MMYQVAMFQQKLWKWNVDYDDIPHLLGLKTFLTTQFKCEVG